MQSLNALPDRWSDTEEQIIAEIQCSETRRDPDCTGCQRCDDVSTKEACAMLCDRPEAIRRLRRRSRDGCYYPPQGHALKQATMGLGRWPKAFIEALQTDLGLSPTAIKPLVISGTKPVEASQEAVTV